MNVCGSNSITLAAVCALCNPSNKCTPVMFFEMKLDW